MTREEFVDKVAAYAAKLMENVDMPPGTRVGHLYESNKRVCKLVRSDADTVVVLDQFNGEQVWPRKGLIDVDFVNELTEKVVKDMVRLAQNARFN